MLQKLPVVIFFYKRGVSLNIGWFCRDVLCQINDIQTRDLMFSQP